RTTDVVYVEYCCTLDRYERGHHHLHACRGFHRSRDELVAGDDHHPPRQYHRPRSNGSQCARRYQVRHFFSRVVPSVIRNERSEHPCDSARNCCLWLVWNSDLDRRRSARCVVWRHVERVEWCSPAYLDRILPVLGH